MSALAATSSFQDTTFAFAEYRAGLREMSDLGRDLLS
jgi:hypothetical protein